MIKTNFVIVKIDDINKTMVIDWGYTRLNHRIPNQLLENPHLTQDEVIDIIEKLRPKKLEPIEIPQSLKSLVASTDQELSQQFVEDEVLL